MAQPTRTRMPAGFSLMEILTVILIIAILSTLSVVVLIKVRDQALDLRRVTDIRSIQDALERYANDHEGIYPTQLVAGQPLMSLDNNTKYLRAVPTNPNPRAAGDCESYGDHDYEYHQGTGGRSYYINYCLINGAAGMAGGRYAAMPTIVGVPQNDICSCEDITKVCCGRCATGSLCGGGQVFAKNLEVAGTTYEFLVSAPTSSESILNSYNTSHCDGLSLNGFDDWHLPSGGELTSWCSSTAMTTDYARSSSRAYWSTTVAVVPPSNMNMQALPTGMDCGPLQSTAKTVSSYRSHCVRFF